MYRRILVSAAAVVWFSFCSSLMAQQDFSAEIVDHQHGADSTPAKVYVTKDRMRIEGMGQSGHNGTVILNFSTRTTTVLIPERQMYMEMQSGQGPTAQRSWAYFRALDVEDACPEWRKMSAKPNAECHKVGSETVNGRSTVKYEGKSSSGEVNDVWLDSKIAIPIKWQGKEGGGELQNIKEGPQSAGLFEIPAGYQKMTLPMGMPSMPQH